jgi:3-oxoadipate enol-lactonase
MLTLTPGTGLHYQVDGPSDAPPLLLINSLGTTIDLWDDHVPRLAGRYRVIRYDARGHGRSGGSGGEFTLDQIGRDALEVLDAAGVESAHIAGISIGGLTSMWLGLNAPSRVKSLFIANTAARVGNTQRWVDRIELVRRSGMAEVAALTMKGWFTPEFATREPAAVERCRAMVAACPPEGYIGFCAVLRDADLRDAIRSISTPSLVLAGTMDPSAALEETRLIAERIPGATFVTLDCAHMSAIERKEEFAAELEGWLARVPTAG